MVVTHNVLCAVNTVFRHNVYAFLFFLPMLILLWSGRPRAVACPQAQAPVGT